MPAKTVEAAAPSEVKDDFLVSGIQMAVDGTDPLPRLIQAAAGRDLADAADRCNVDHATTDSQVAETFLQGMP